MRAVALLDSNVCIAAVFQDHVHHAESAALWQHSEIARFAIASHSIAESYVTLTRLGSSAPFRFSAGQAWAAVERFCAPLILLGLTPAQSFDTVRLYARAGGIGARLYDALIGEVARIHGVPMIVTWNTGHMAGLFPELRVVTPSEFIKPGAWVGDR